MSTSGEPSINSASETTDSPASSPDLSPDLSLSERQTTPDSDPPANSAPNSDPNSDTHSAPNSDNVPLLDYKALALFLLEPLVDGAKDLQVSSEVTAQGRKVSLRVSLGQAERGRAFGRGGRNIRAIRTILRAAGKNVGQNVSLEIIGGEGEHRGDRPKPKPRKAGEPRPSRPKPKPKKR